jgi:thiamine biosynthesis lipoprotein
MPSKTNRRAFLSGRSALEALADVALGEPAAQPPHTGTNTGPVLISVQREAMACEFEILQNAGQYPTGTDAAIAALDRIDLLEGQLSVYRLNSEVSELNRRAAHAPVVVEPGLFGLCKQAAKLSQATGGAFDITAGPLSKVWGFFRRQGAMPSSDDVRQALDLVGSRLLQLDPVEQSLHFQKVGMEINLGAIGKGYALDRAADLMDERGVRDVLIHGGNSSVLARGSRTAGDGWIVALRHPLKPDERLAEFRLRNQALGTSGSGTHFFHYQGKRYGHILDPRTGWPAEGVLAATVIAPTAAQSDALSTALYVLGPERAAEFCARHPENAALLVTPGKRAGSFELHPFNLADDAWRCLVE